MDHGGLVALAPGASPWPQPVGANNRPRRGRCHRSRRPGVPFAGAIGTAVHDQQAQIYATQQHDRHQVAAPADKAAAPTGPAAVLQARWRAGDVESAGTLDWTAPTKDAAGADIWVDNNGRQVGPPAASWQAVADAVVAAVGFWLAATAAAAVLVALVRRGLRHARYNAWNREFAGLVHDNGGRTGRHR